MTNLRPFETYVTQQGIQYVVSPRTANGMYTTNTSLIVGHAYLTIQEHDQEVYYNEEVILPDTTIAGVPYTQNPYESPGVLPPEIPAEIEILRPDIYVQPVPEKNLLWIIGIIILFIFMMR